MSIKVAIRLRPFNTKEKDSQLCIDMVDNTTIIKDDLGNEKKFTFDNSFWSCDGFEVEADGYARAVGEKYADQMTVYKCLGVEILDNAWEGYNCCLFAYGQTGSGKSYSMVGYGANKGIVPIACEEIFKRIDKSNEGTKFEVCVSMLEIYNEKVQDLLAGAKDRPKSGLKIRESKTLGVFVEGLTKYPVTSFAAIAAKMEEGYENRTIGSTLMNATSSRAHTIVTIEFKQIWLNSKTEKKSNINLVDLAGSEKIGLTGATGDRLKEGCNINKSLLVLGNVINVLADKALGKKKDVLPPYRDAALTRILSNALGGNSKTVMICAISPSSLYYEESLSTLRYADRAKKIQNRAVINESVSDKMIRQLKEENLELKKLIEEISFKLGTDGTLGETDKKGFLDLKEQYEANAKEVEEMQKSFQEKLAEAKSNQIFEEKVDVNAPHLIVLNEDPQLSFKLRYSLKSLPVFVGRKNGKPTPLITLSGIGVKVNHAIFERGDNNEIILKANEPEAKDFIFVNGNRLISGFSILHQRDRIAFGTNAIFIYLQKFEESIVSEIEWEFAQNELQREIEKSQLKVEEENEKKKKKEMETLRRDLEEKYAREKEEIEEKLRKQLTDYEKKIKEMNQTVEKSKIEKSKFDVERKNAEIILKKKLEELENQKKEEKAEISKIDSRLENQLQNLIKKLNKLKIIVNEVKRKIDLSPFISKLDGKIEILIKVENFEEGFVYYWDLETFLNRYDLLKELFDQYQDDDFDLYNLKQKDDPLWDEAKHYLLGSGYYKLEPLAYLMNNPVLVSVVAPSGEVKASLSVDLFPLLTTEEEVVEEPSELLSKSLSFEVRIKEITGLPEYNCKDVFVEFCSFVDKKKYRTEIASGRHLNAKFDQKFGFKIEILSEDDIIFLKQENLCFNVFAIEEVEKKHNEKKEKHFAFEIKDDLKVESVENKAISTPANSKSEAKKDCSIY